MTEKEIAKFLRKYLEENNLLVWELADQIGITAQNLSKILAENYKIGIRVQRKIEDFIFNRKTCESNQKILEKWLEVNSVGNINNVSLHYNKFEFQEERADKTIIAFYFNETVIAEIFFYTNSKIKEDNFDLIIDNGKVKFVLHPSVMII